MSKRIRLIVFGILGFVFGLLGTCPGLTLLACILTFCLAFLTIWLQDNWWEYLIIGIFLAIGVVLGIIIL